MNLVEQLAAVKAMQVALAAAETHLKSEVMRLSEVTGATMYSLIPAFTSSR